MVGVMHWEPFKKKRKERGEFFLAKTGGQGGGELLRTGAGRLMGDKWPGVSIGIERIITKWVGGQGETSLEGKPRPGENAPKARDQLRTWHSSSTKKKFKTANLRENGQYTPHNTLHKKTPLQRDSEVAEAGSLEGRDNGRVRFES